MPPNGAQRMRDCHPQRGGGLRSFYRRVTLTSVTSPQVPAFGSSDIVFGLFAHPAGGISPTSERYMMVLNTSTSVARLLYATSGAWTTIRTFAATNPTPVVRQSFFTTYLSSGIRKVAFNLNLGSSDDGIWIVTGGGAPVKLTITGGTGPSGPITVHQARLVITDGSKIRWSDVGLETFPAANNLDVEPSGLRPNNVIMVAFEPSDLLIGKEAGPLVLVQGDLSDPIVRAMDESNVVVAQVPAKGPGGVIFVAHRDGVYTSSGNATQKLSNPLGPTDFGLPTVFGSYTPSWIGNSVMTQGYLFTPSALLDTTTGAWFTSGQEVGNFTAPLFVYDRGTV